MSPTPAELQAMRALAEKATGGQWSAADNGMLFVEVVHQIAHAECCGQAQFECGGRGCVGPIESGHEELAQEPIGQASPVDAAFIAAAHPQAVIGLINRISQLEAGVADLHRLSQEAEAENRHLIDALVSARAAIREVVDWHEKAGLQAGDDGCDYLNEGGWEELVEIVGRARAHLGGQDRKEG